MHDLQRVGPSPPTGLDIAPIICPCCIDKTITIAGRQSAYVWVYVQEPQNNLSILLKYKFTVQQHGPMYLDLKDANREETMNIKT